MSTYAKGLLLIPDVHWTHLFMRSCLNLQHEHNHKILLQNKVQPLARILIHEKVPFHNNIQFEAKDVIPCAARNLHRIIMLQLHGQNNFMRC